MIIVKIMARNLCSGCPGSGWVIVYYFVSVQAKCSNFFLFACGQPEVASFHILFCWMVYLSITLVCSSGAVLVLRKKCFCRSVFG
jgi:hypothetical protein